MDEDVLINFCIDNNAFMLLSEVCVICLWTEKIVKYFLYPFKITINNHKYDYICMGACAGCRESINIETCGKNLAKMLKQLGTKEVKDNE